jgi:hypothetical protein
MLQAIGLTKTAAVVLAVAVTIGFAFMFRHLEDAAIERPIRLTFGVMMLRAVLAAVTIVVITGAAKWIGTRWSGLLAAFPTTLFPLMLIVHFNYGSAAVNTIIKNFPRGLGSLILYALCVSVVYPRWGVYLGTFVSFAVATTYLAVYGTLVSKTGN